MIHLDLSQLLLDPRQSGIQRAERALIRHWPRDVPLAPCVFDAESGAMRGLPAGLLEALRGEPAAGGVAAELARLRRFCRPGAIVRPERLLTAELFLDAGRAAYYARRRAPSYWVVYDFLPWLQPDWFGTGAAGRLMPYVHALRHVSHLAFISERTRVDCAERVLRRPQPGPVIPMGADGLGLERQFFAPGRQSFVMLGTIEPRKNAAAAIRAFKALWAQGVEAELVMIGLLPPDAVAERALIRSVSGDARFRHLQDLPDAGVREALRRARAMVFPSQGEGYGIPPMEALHAGIPVIVAADLPALAGHSARGVLALDPVDPGTIAAAVRAMLDDATARRLWEEAAGLRIPGWAEFAQGVARWVQA